MPNFEIENRVQNQTRENGSDATSQRLLEGAMILGRSAAGADNELQRGGRAGGGGRANQLEHQFPQQLDFYAVPLQGFDDKINNQRNENKDDKLPDTGSKMVRSMDPGEDLRSNDRSEVLNRTDSVRDKNNSDKSVARGPGVQPPWERREDRRGLKPRQNEDRLHQVAQSPRFWS